MSTRSIKVSSAQSWRWDEVTGGLLKTGQCAAEIVLREKFPRAEIIPKESIVEASGLRKGYLDQRLNSVKFCMQPISIALKAQNLTAIEW
jgi:hypothetical protein